MQKNRKGRLPTTKASETDTPEYEESEAPDRPPGQQSCPAHAAQKKKGANSQPSALQNDMETNVASLWFSQVVAAGVTLTVFYAIRGG